jgi:hypothetical protein
MSDNVREKIEARLRKRHDDDLREATAGIESGVLSEMVRDGLRIMLGIRTKRQLEVKERPLLIPPVQSTGQTMRRTLADAGKSVPSKPAIFKPSNIGGV